MRLSSYTFSLTEPEQEFRKTKKEKLNAESLFSISFPSVRISNVFL